MDGGAASSEMLSAAGAANAEGMTMDPSILLGYDMAGVLNRKNSVTATQKGE